MSPFSAAIMLFLVMDPFGNIPFFLSVLKDVPAPRRRWVLVRELCIALAILSVFLLLGRRLLTVLQVSESSLYIAGGIILFLIAIKMIFGSPEEMVQGAPGGEPLVVPLAVPSIAGPSAVATVLLLVGQDPERRPEWMLALLLAWGTTAVILLGSSILDRLLGERGLSALQRLMGLILTTLSVEMFLKGVRAAFV